MKPIEPILSSPILVPAFNNVLPALFGGLAAMLMPPNLKFSIIPFSIAFISGILLGISSTIRVPLTLILTVGFVILNQKNKDKKDKVINK